jgi:long-chain fatty acid transport protein
VANSSERRRVFPGVATERLRSCLAWTFVLCLGISLAYSSPALPSGYGLRESSIVALGSAYAGASATSSDASFMSYNPASLAGVRGYDSAIGIAGILVSSSATYSATTSAGSATGGNASPRDFIRDALVPDLAARFRLSPNWAVGISIYEPWGISDKYPAGWTGRYYTDETSLLTVNIEPTVSYQLAPRFSVGAGLQIQYAKGKLSTISDAGTLGALSHIPGAVPGSDDVSAKVRADDWGVGFTIGAMGDVTDSLSVGVSYRSAVNHTLEGPLNFTLDGAGIGLAIRSATGVFTNTDAKAELTTPDIVSLGGRFKLSDRWTALGEIEWTNWSRFRELRIQAANPAQPDVVTVANWNDSWFVSAGAEYAPDEHWLWRAGAGWDQTPIPSATLEPRIPDADRTWIAAGLTYRTSEGIDISLSAAHLFLPNRTVALTQAQPGNALRGNLSGTTKSSITIVGVQVSYHLPK